MVQACHIYAAVHFIYLSKYIMHFPKYRKYSVSPRVLDYVVVHFWLDEIRYNIGQVNQLTYGIHAVSDIT